MHWGQATGQVFGTVPLKGYSPESYLVKASTNSPGVINYDFNFWPACSDTPNAGYALPCRSAARDCARHSATLASTLAATLSSLAVLGPCCAQCHNLFSSKWARMTWTGAGVRITVISSPPLLTAARLFNGMDRSCCIGKRALRNSS